VRLLIPFRWIVGDGTERGITVSPEEVTKVFHYAEAQSLPEGG
jgi:hypothetical protein